MHEHGHSTGRRLLGRVLALGTLVLVAVAVTVVRVDATTASPITDYAAYPAAHPAGCPDGAGALVGLSFDNGRGGTASSLWALDVEHGDTVTMHWSSFHASCTAGGDPVIAVALAAHDAPTATFDPAVDQQLARWSACGAGAGTCPRADGRFHLALIVPGTEVCNVQLDAVLGLPLQVVGPGGSFYSSGSRGFGPNRLLSAANFSVTPCEAGPTSTAPTSTTIGPASTSSTVAAAESSSTTTTVAATTTSVVVAASYSTSTTNEPASTTSTTETGPTLVHSSGSTPIDTGVPPTAYAVGETKVLAESAERGPLPFTGAATLAVVAVAAALAATGTVLVVGARRARRRPAA